MERDESDRQKDHELAVNIVCQYFPKTEQGRTVEIVSASTDQSQNPQVVAKVDGILIFILVRVARYPDEATIEDAAVAAFKKHAASFDAEVGFAPVGLWPTGEKDAEGNDGFYVKFEGVQRL